MYKNLYLIHIKSYQIFLIFKKLNVQILEYIFIYIYLKYIKNQKNTCQYYPYTIYYSKNNGTRVDMRLNFWMKSGQNHIPHKGIKCHDQ
jgi:hypothetical protein